MGLDVWVSHKGYNEYCKWWERDEDDENDSDELIMKREPSGFFYAKEQVAESADSSIIGGKFLLDRNRITIKTRDNVQGIKNNCLVLFQNEVWIVDVVQRKHLRSGNTEFAKEEDATNIWFIQMRK